MLLRFAYGSLGVTISGLLKGFGFLAGRPLLVSESELGFLLFLVFLRCLLEFVFLISDVCFWGFLVFVRFSSFFCFALPIDSIAVLTVLGFAVAAICYDVCSKFNGKRQATLRSAT